MVTSMVKLNNLNYAMWKTVMENFLTTLICKEAKTKDISDLECKNMNKTTIAYIKQWIDATSHHHVENETNSHIYGRRWNQCLNNKLLQ